MERITTYINPSSPMSEAYRSLCVNVLAGLKGKKVVEVVAVADNNNASTIVANLAVAMAQAEKNVLLMDCNLHDPKQQDLFVLKNCGITDCLNSSDNYKTFVQSTAQSNLFVLTAGGSVANPIETLLSRAMDTMLSEVRESYDVVLLDVPPLAKVFDAVALGTKTDGVLLVLVNKQDKVEQALTAKEMFKCAGVNLLGCILDKA